MIIAQISDTHLALDTADAAQRRTDFERVIADINALDPQPDVIIHTGDIVQNGLREEYQAAARIMAEARAPLFAMMGNKDDRAMAREILSPPGYLPADGQFVAFAIDLFPVHLILLDTLDPGSNKGNFCAERLAQLNALAGQDDHKPVIVFAHHPPYIVPVGPDPLHFGTEAVMERFRQALAQIERLKAVVCGHVHRGHTGWLGAVPIPVMPCVATSLRRGEYPPYLQDSPIYHIHRYDAARGFSTEARIV